MLMGFLRRFDDCPITNNTIMLPAIPTDRGINNPVNIITFYCTAVFYCIFHCRFKVLEWAHVLFYFRHLCFY